MQGCLKGFAVTIMALLVAIFAFAAGFGLSALYGTPAGGQPSIPVPINVFNQTPPSEFGVFWESWNIIQKEFYGKIPDSKQMTYAAIRGAIKALNDPHTVFLEPRSTERESEQLRGDFEGIGAYISFEKDQFVITAPIAGSPAEKAGIQAGDIILKVDDKDVRGLALEDVVALIRGPRGTKVKLTLLRLGKSDSLVLEVTRDTIKLPSVIWRMQENDIGYVRLTIFGEKSKDEIVNAINDLKNKGAKTLIFDLRNNPGGYLNSAIDVASLFIKDGVVAYERGKDGKEKEFKASGNGVWTDLPLVILVDKGSASASEIVAGAVQDRKRGALIGDTSFGKGSVQSVHQLSDKSSIHVTIAEWLTPNKTQITGKGLTPDMSIPISPEDQQRGNDTQLQAAIQYLKEKK